MDRLIYIAMTGAKQLLERQAVVANNLANVSTAGYRAAVSALRALPVIGPGAGTRAYVAETTIASDLRGGPLMQTGRALDVAVMGEGWIAVQGRDGREAYTRSGDLQVSGNGLLQTRGGLNVLGDREPITIPPNNQIAIGVDGTVSAIPTDSTPNAVSIVGRIKLVNPRPQDIERGADGMFRLTRGRIAPADGRIRLASGVLEGSNVSMVESLVDMIAHARQYETQLKLLQTAENNARQWSQVMNLSA